LPAAAGRSAPAIHSAPRWCGGRGRLDYLIELYAQIGLPPAEAPTFGLHALSAYLGVQHLILTVPRELSAQTRADYTTHLVATLVPD
jgi:hypothetical protein